MPSRQMPEELVSLHEATAVAFHLVAERVPGKMSAGELVKIRSQVALALSAVATILATDEAGIARPIPAAELEERLFRPLWKPAHQRADDGVDLSALYIRRGDLVRAIEQLKGARSSFLDPKDD
jgi:hypothetical protein